MYKLDKKWFSENGKEIVKFSRWKKFYGVYELHKEDVFKSVSKNQELLEELYNMGKPYVIKKEQKVKEESSKKSKDKE